MFREDYVGPGADHESLSNYRQLEGLEEVRLYVNADARRNRSPGAFVFLLYGGPSGT